MKTTPLYCPVCKETCRGADCAWWSDDQTGCAVAGAETVLETMCKTLEAIAAKLGV